MKKVNKILFSVLSIVLVLTMMIVPAFADSVRDTTDDFSDYSNSWAVLDWSGVSLHSPSYLDYYENGIQDTQTFIIGDVFADDSQIRGYTNILGATGQNYINPPNIKYYYYNNERGYYNALDAGDILSGAYSVDNHFTMPSVYLYFDDDSTEKLLDGVHLTYLVPQYLSDALLQGTCDYLDITFNYSMEILADDNGQNEPYWYGLENKYVTYSPTGSNSNPSIHPLTDLSFNQSVSGTLPQGFSLITLKVPFEDIVGAWVEGYEEFSDALIFRNLTFNVTVDYDADVLLNQLNNIGNMYDDSEITNWYYHTVIDNTVFGGRTLNELPLFSVTTDKANPSHNELYYVLDVYTEIVSDDVTIINPVQIDGSLVGWLGRTVGQVLDVELFGTFSLSTILYVVFGAGLLFAIIKFFAGG